MALYIDHPVLIKNICMNLTLGNHLELQLQSTMP